MRQAVDDRHISNAWEADQSCNFQVFFDNTTRSQTVTTSFYDNVIAFSRLFTDSPSVLQMSDKSVAKFEFVLGMRNTPVVWLFSLLTNIAF